MQERQDRLIYLHRLWFDRRASSEELEEFYALLSEAKGDAEWYPLIRDIMENAQDNGEYGADKKQALARFILAEYPNTTETEFATFNRPPVHRVHFLKTAWFRYAAAILLILTSLSVYYIFSHISQPGNRVTQTTPPPVLPDVPPGYNRAVLTLSNGQKVTLDSAGAKTIRDQTVAIKNQHGHLSYENASEVFVNTMSTPNGGQYQLTLADGTKVWLNAASSITYPTSFPGNTREVSITGEAYFEVAKNKMKPFVVKTTSEEITVLGTAFNVNTYINEPFTKTSLLEGSVKINDKILMPGQAFENERIVTTDLRKDIAWKNGFFSFRDADIKTVMRQLARWYDVDVQYEGKVTDRLFDGEIGRSLTLAQVLDILSGARIKYKIENRTIILLSE